MRSAQQMQAKSWRKGAVTALVGVLGMLGAGLSVPAFAADAAPTWTWYDISAFDGKFRAGEVSADEQSLYGVGSLAGDAQAWVAKIAIDTREVTTERAFEEGDLVTALVEVPEENELWVGLEESTLDGVAGPALWVLDADTLEIKKSIPGLSSLPRRIHRDADPQKVLWQGNDASVEEINVEANEITPVIAGEKDVNAYSSAVTADAKTIAVLVNPYYGPSNDSVIRFVDVASGEIVSEYAGDRATNGNFLDIVYAPERNTFVTSTEEGWVREFDATDFSQVESTKFGTREFESIAMIDASRVALTTLGVVTVFDLDGEPSGFS